MISLDTAVRQDCQDCNDLTAWLQDWRTGGRAGRTRWSELEQNQTHHHVWFGGVKKVKEMWKVCSKPAGCDHMRGCPTAGEGMGSVGMTAERWTWRAECLRVSVRDIMKMCDEILFLLNTCRLTSVRPSEGFLKGACAGNLVLRPSPDSSLGTLCR